MCFLCRRGILGTQTCIPDPNSWPGLNHRCPLKKPPSLPAALRTLGWLNVSAKCKTKADIAEVPESSTPSVSGLHINSLAWYYLSLQPMIMLSQAHHHSPYIGTERAIAGLPSDCKSWAGWVARRFSVAETWAGSSGEPRGAGSSILGLRCQSPQYRRLSDIFIRNLCSTWSRFFFLPACFLPSPGCPPSFHLKSIRPSRFSFRDYSSMVFSPFSETPPMASCQYRNHMLFWFPQARG